MPFNGFSGFKWHNGYSYNTNAKYGEVRFEYIENKIVCTVVDEIGCEYIATTKCDPRDAYNKEYGEKLALSRATNKMLDSQLRELEECIENERKALFESQRRIYRKFDKIINRKDKV